MDRILAACICKALKGELERGPGGVILLEEEEVAYLMPHEIQEEGLREKIIDCMKADGGKNFFILHKHGKTVHVSMLPRVTPPDMPRLQ